MAKNKESLAADLPPSPPLPPSDNGEVPLPIDAGDLGGFKDVGPAGGPRNYFKLSVGAWVRGELLGRFQRKGGDEEDPRFYYQIRVTKPCEHAVRMSEDDEERQTYPVNLQPGDVVNVDERVQLEDLHALVEDMAHRYEVFLQATKKMKHPKDPRKSIWKFTVRERVMGKKENPF